MGECTFEIRRERLAQYMKAICLIAGLLVPGLLLWLLGVGKAVKNWAQSLEYRMDEESLSVSSCVTLWGFVLSRREKCIPLAKITDMKLVQGPILNKMDLWLLQIQTAGAGYQFPEATLYALDKPHEVREQIQLAIAKLQAGNK